MTKTIDEQIAAAERRVRDLKRRKVEEEYKHVVDKWKALCGVFPGAADVSLADFEVWVQSLSALTEEDRKRKEAAKQQQAKTASTQAQQQPKPAPAQAAQQKPAQ